MKAEKAHAEERKYRLERCRCRGETGAKLTLRVKNHSIQWDASRVLLRERGRMTPRVASTHLDLLSACAFGQTRHPPLRQPQWIKFSLERAVIISPVYRTGCAEPRVASLAGAVRQPFARTLPANQALKAAPATSGGEKQRIYVVMGARNRFPAKGIYQRVWWVYFAVLYCRGRSSEEQFRAALS